MLKTNGASMVGGIVFAAMLLYLVFFNRTCLRGMMRPCEVCPHVTIWEHLTR